MQHRNILSTSLAILHTHSLRILSFEVLSNRYLSVLLQLTNMFYFWLLLLFGSFPDSVRALLWPAPVVPPLVVDVSTCATGGNEAFQQFIDHSNPKLGTFSQRYWWNSTYWDGPGSPVRTKLMPVFAYPALTRPGRHHHTRGSFSRKVHRLPDKSHRHGMVC